MNVPPLDAHRSRGCVEILIFQFAGIAAIHRVGIVCAEFLHVELHDSSADFLVWSEADLDFAVFEFRMSDNIFNSVHYFSHARLVVCPQQCGAVRGYELLTHELQQLREFRRLQRQARHPAKRNLAAVIFIYYLWLDVGAGCIRRSVNMGDEADFRGLNPFRGRNRSHDVAIFIKLCLHSHGLQLVAEHFQQVQLFGSRRLGLRFFVALSVHADIS